MIRNAGSVNIEHCKFMENNGSRPYLDDENILNFTTQNSGGIALLYDNFSRGVAHVENCVFLDCSASDSSSNPNHLPYSYVPYGHGGALFIHYYCASNINVSVINSEFINNTAHHSGGAITVSMIKSPRNNQVVIRNTSFTNCHAERTGGGLSIQVMTCNFSCYYRGINFYIAV